MFPLYNPSRDYMQAFAAAKRSAEPQFMDEESRFNALDQVHSLLYDLSEFEDTSTQCNWGLFSDIELATLYNKVPSKRFEIIMTDDPTAEQYAAMVKKYIPNFKAPATWICRKTRLQRKCFKCKCPADFNLRWIHFW
jgi:hypothetical protein